MRFRVRIRMQVIDGWRSATRQRTVLCDGRAVHCRTVKQKVTTQWFRCFLSMFAQRTNLESTELMPEAVDVLFPWWRHPQTSVMTRRLGPPNQADSRIVKANSLRTRHVSKIQSERFRLTPDDRCWRMISDSVVVSPHKTILTDPQYSHTRAAPRGWCLIVKHMYNRDGV